MKDEKVTAQVRPGSVPPTGEPHTRCLRRTCKAAAVVLAALTVVVTTGAQDGSLIGKEVSIPRHLQDGEEFELSIPKLIQFGEKLFTAKFTIQEGAGRPLTKGTGNPLSDPTSPLVFPTNFDRLSSPDANSCAGCHNAPTPGGGGDRVTEVFVLAQRFDRLTFDHNEKPLMPTRGTMDESGQYVTLDNATDDRKTISMNGSGFIEMLARQMTADLQAEAALTPIGGSTPLTSKGVSFGTLIHKADGSWDTSKVEGLVAPSLSTSGQSPPSLIIRPLHQASNVVSLRQFSNNAFNHHHGMQAEERFGHVDADGDGFTNELTTADLTAVSIYQATLAVPGRVIPNDPAVERANLEGEVLFKHIGCTRCHVPTLSLTANNNPGLPGPPGWVYFEPNPYNPLSGPNSPNLQLGPANYSVLPFSAPARPVDLTGEDLPQPRLHPVNGVVMVPAYTDLKVHDLSATGNAATGDPECEPLDQNQPPTLHGGAPNPKFFAGNCKFITRKLWGFYNQGGAFMHHGKFTTAREAVEAHNGEAATEQQNFDNLTPDEKNDVIEFLKSLQILPSGSESLVVDEHGRPKHWPPLEFRSEE